MSVLLADLQQDFRYALRVLRRSPGFTAVGVATLAFGIGATTAIFAVVDSVLLRPLRFAQPDRLAFVQLTSGSRISAAYLHEWRIQAAGFDDMAGWLDTRMNLTGAGEPLELPVDRVTANFFAVLGTPPFLGRVFSTSAPLTNVDREVVLSYGFWQRQYGGDSGVIGRAATLDGEAFTIVGVMPRGFAIRTNELAESRADAWIPFPLVPGDLRGMGGFLNVVGRLAPGVTFEQAHAELSSISRRIEQEHPSFSRNWDVKVVPLHEATIKDVRPRLLVVFGAVGVLLLSACGNVANLVLSRAAARRGEVAIRLALGATRGRLVRQLLAESVVLALAGGALGVVLAVWGTSLLIANLPAGLELPRTTEIRVDARILGFALLATIATMCFFGLVPAIAASRSGALSGLRDAARGSSAAGGNRAGNAMVVSEVALAAILLAAAGLLGRSFWQLQRIDPGFAPDHVLTLRTTLPDAKYDTDDRIRTFTSDLVERIGHLPGVRAVGLVNYLPLSSVGIGGLFRIEGRPEVRAEDQPNSWMSRVGGRYFEAMGIPLLRGRLPTAADTDKTLPVFVIDEALARRYWPGADPVGARVVWSLRGESVTGEVVGVVGSVRWATLAAGPQPTTYFWMPQTPSRELSIVVRTLGNPNELARAITAQVREIDPGQPVAEVRPLQDFLSADLAQPRFTTVLLGSFAGAALLLAALGLYGVVGLAVTRRTREIGVRVALGAQRRDVLRLMMTSSMALVGAGLAIGIAGALALGRVLTNLLYGVTPTDPATLAGVVLFLAGAALLASYLPARRALRVEPTVALRSE